MTGDETAHTGEGCMPLLRAATALLVLLACPGSAAAPQAAAAAADTTVEAAAPAPAGAACPAPAIRLPPGVDIGAVVSRSEQGASFCLGAGEHRMQAITPKNHQSFHGEPGAILNGSRRLSKFTREGRYWVASGQDQRGWRRLDVPCVPQMPRCGYPEAVFIDDVPLVHAASLSEVSDGKFLFDYDASKIYLGTDPRGRKVEVSVRQFAFKGGAHGVRITGLVVEKYAPSLQFGAIGDGVRSEDWTVQDNEIRLNSSTGVVVGSRSRVLRNRIHGNGQLGAGCVGEDILFEDNEVSRNGHFRGAVPFWEGGGVKCAKTARLTFRRNRVASNNGVGLWADYDNIHTLYEDNTLARNVNSGISHEISYNAVIRNNRLYGNGDGFHVWLWGGAIQVQNSQNVEVHGNTVIAFAGNGISLIQQDRGSGSHGDFRTVNNRVYGNTVVSMTRDGGKSGAVADHDQDGMNDGNNVFSRNTYRVHDMGGAYWAWDGGFRGWAEYRARSGQDHDSTLGLLDPERDGQWDAVRP